MKWFYNLKLAPKLLLAISTVLLLMIVLGIFSIRMLSDVNGTSTDMETNWMPSINATSDMNTNTSDFRVAELQHILSLTPADMDRYEKEMDTQLESLHQNQKKYEPLISSDEERKLYESFTSAWNEYMKVHARILLLSRQNKNEEAKALLRGDSQKYFDQASAFLMKDNDLNDKGGQEASQRGDALYATSRLWIILLLGASVLIGVLLAIFLAKLLSKGITRVLTEMETLSGVDITNLGKGSEQLGDGDLNIKIVTAARLLEVTSEDEIGQLTKSMNLIITNTQSTIASVDKAIGAIRQTVDESKLLVDAALAGKLSVRGNQAKFKGSYRDIIEGVNHTLDAVINPLNVSAEYVDRISKGDIPPRITDTYNGDFNEIKNNLNVCIDAVNALVVDAGMLSKAAVEGKLATRADAAKHHGDFRKIVLGVNETLDAVVGPLREVGSVMSKMTEGDFNARIAAAYQGDFDNLKKDITRSANRSIRP